MINFINFFDAKTKRTTFDKKKIISKNAVVS